MYYSYVESIAVIQAEFKWTKRVDKFLCSCVQIMPSNRKAFSA